MFSSTPVLKRVQGRDKDRNKDSLKWVSSALAAPGRYIESGQHQSRRWVGCKISFVNLSLSSSQELEDMQPAFLGNKGDYGESFTTYLVILKDVPLHSYFL